MLPAQLFSLFFVVFYTVASMVFCTVSSPNVNYADV